MITWFGLQGLFRFDFSLPLNFIANVTEKENKKDDSRFWYRRQSVKVENNKINVGFPAARRGRSRYREKINNKDHHQKLMQELWARAEELPRYRRPWARNFGWPIKKLPRSLQNDSINNIGACLAKDKVFFIFWYKIYEVYNLPKIIQ